MVSTGFRPAAFRSAKFGDVYDAGTGNATVPVMPPETSEQEREIAQVLVEFGTREVTKLEQAVNSLFYYLLFDPWL